MTSQPESHQIADTNINCGSFSLIRQSRFSYEDVTSAMQMPAGATCVLPPAVAPRPKQPKRVCSIMCVCLYTLYT